MIGRSVFDIIKFLISMKWGLSRFDVRARKELGGFYCTRIGRRERSSTTEC